MCCAEEEKEFCVATELVKSNKMQSVPLKYTFLKIILVTFQTIYSTWFENRNVKEEKKRRGR
jgi:hypothetical protein